MGKIEGAEEERIISSTTCEEGMVSGRTPSDQKNENYTEAIATGSRVCYDSACMTRKNVKKCNSRLRYWTGFLSTDRVRSFEPREAQRGYLDISRIPEKRFQETADFDSRAIVNASER